MPYLHFWYLSRQRNTFDWPHACVSTEVGKNINQEKALNLKRYVEDYHKYVSSLNFPSFQPDAKDHQHAGRRVRKRKGMKMCPKTESYYSLVHYKIELMMENLPCMVTLKPKYLEILMSSLRFLGYPFETVWITNDIMFHWTPNLLSV